jgi:membrane fusion protein, heavy metal efflux system
VTQTRHVLTPKTRYVLTPTLTLRLTLAMMAIAAATAAAGCRGSQAPPPQQPASTQTAAPKAKDNAAAGAAAANAERPPTPAPTHAATPDVLNIAPEMLRDLRITTVRIDARPGAEAASLLGELRVDERRYAEIGSPIVARTMRLIAAPGDRVKPGNGLAVLHSGELGKARADYIAASARLEFATRTLARKQDLATERITPLREVQEAEAQKTAAEAEVRAARATLAAFGVTPERQAPASPPSASAPASGVRTDVQSSAAPASGSKTQPEAAAGSQRGLQSAAAAGAARDVDDGSRFVLRSPIAGTVLDRTIATGQMVDPAKAVFRVADLTRVWLVVHAFERDAVRLAEGAQARVTLPALPGRVFEGRVSFIGREVDPTSRTIPVRIELSNADGLLRPGMSASASLPVGSTPSTLMVPAAAVQRVNDQWCVFMPAPRGEGASSFASSFTIHAVGRGRDFGNDVEVLSGLHPGDTVVVEGAFLLRAEAEKARGGSGAGAGSDHD